MSELGQHFQLKKKDPDFSPSIYETRSGPFLLNMVPTSVNCHDVGVLEINGHYPIRVKCLHTLIKFSLIIPYRLIKWQIFASVWNTFPPAKAPKTGAAELNLWGNTVLLAWRRLLLTRGSPRSAVGPDGEELKVLVHRSLCGITMTYCINIADRRVTSVQGIWKRAGGL